MRNLTAAILLATLTPAAYASDEVRCGNAIVSKSISPEELVDKCGEPTSKKVVEEDIRAANAGGGTRKVGTTLTETWIYDGGSQAFDLVVTIVDGKIKSIVSNP